MRVQSALSRSRLESTTRGLFDGLIFPSKNQLRFEPKVLKFLRLYSALNNPIYSRTISTAANSLPVSRWCTLNRGGVVPPKVS